jgi:hypothetical protein
MNKTTVKVLVDTTGLNGKPVNPHDNKFTGGAYNDGHTTEYWDFDKAHPLLALTEKQEPNTLVECELVWQFKEAKELHWETENEGAYKNHESFNAYADFYDDDYFETRQAYKVIAPIEKINPMNALTDDMGLNAMPLNPFDRNCNPEQHVAFEADYPMLPLNEIAESNAVVYVVMTGNIDYDNVINRFSDCAYSVIAPIKEEKPGINHFRKG